jgi:hypothetical protein
MIQVNNWHGTPDFDRDHGSRGISMKPHGQNSGGLVQRGSAHSGLPPAV